VAPRVQRRFGTAKTLYVTFALFAVDLAVIGVFSTTPAGVIVGVIVAGAFIGTNNTLVTTAVMSIAPVERPVASATYGFVRFIGGGLAPFVAGLIVEAWDPQAHLPFFIAAVTVAAAAVVLSTVRGALAKADRGEVAQPEPTRLDRVEGRDPVAGGIAVADAD